MCTTITCSIKFIKSKDINQGVYCLNDQWVHFHLIFCPIILDYGNWTPSMVGVGGNYRFSFIVQIWHSIDFKNYDATFLKIIIFTIKKLKPGGRWSLNKLVWCHILSRWLIFLNERPFPDTTGWIVWHTRGGWILFMTTWKSLVKLMEQKWFTKIYEHGSNKWLNNISNINRTCNIK